MNTYCYILKLNPRLWDDASWTEHDHQIVHQHYLRLKTDFESGKLLHVGRTDDPTHDGFGIVVFRAENIEDAKHYMKEDPAIIGRQMTGMCFEYRLIFHQQS